MNSFDDGGALGNCSECGEPPMAAVHKGKTRQYRVKCINCDCGVSSASRTEAERIWNALQQNSIRGALG